VSADANRSHTVSDGGLIRANSSTASRMRVLNSASLSCVRAVPMIANGSGSVREA